MVTSARKNYTRHVTLNIRRQEVPRVKEQQSKCTVGNKATGVVARGEKLRNREGRRPLSPTAWTGVRGTSVSL